MKQVERERERDAIPKKINLNTSTILSKSQSLLVVGKTTANFGGNNKY